MRKAAPVTSAESSSGSAASREKNLIVDLRAWRATNREELRADLPFRAREHVAPFEDWNFYRPLARVKLESRERYDKGRQSGSMSGVFFFTIVKTINIRANSYLCYMHKLRILSRQDTKNVYIYMQVYFIAYKVRVFAKSLNSLADLQSGLSLFARRRHSRRRFAWNANYRLP